MKVGGKLIRTGQVWRRGGTGRNAGHQQSLEELERRVEERTAELKASEERFRQLAEASFETIAISENGIFVDGNNQLAAMHGFELEDLIGRPVSELVAPASRELVARRMREGYEGTYECEGLRKDGTSFPVEVRAKMMDWSGKKLRVTIVRDLSGVKRTEAELETHRIALGRAEKLALLTKISAGIVHQIGQPVTAIGNNVAAARARLASAGIECGEVVDAILDIDSELKRVRKTIDCLRSLAHPEQSDHRPERLADIVDESLEQLGELVALHEVRVTLNLPADLPLILVDALQMSQVVFNVVQNAIEAVASEPLGDRALTVGARKVGEGFLEFTVCDSGPGISEEEAKTLFEPFYTTKEDGCGIGLALSQTIVAAHGGHLEFYNNEDQSGATFRVLLPLASQSK